MFAPCSYDPRPLLDAPIGMFHCPECGEMVLAGMAHLPTLDEIEFVETYRLDHGNGD